MTQRGFTLIEVLVAMTLLAVLGVLGYRGLESVRQAATQVEQTAARWQEIQGALERLGRDVRQTVGRGRGGALEVSFTRIDPQHGGSRSLAYRWREGQLELLLGAQVYPLLAGVRALEFAYLDGNQRWQERWGANLPRALRLRLELAEGGRI